jgi:hypothetical protein
LVAQDFDLSMLRRALQSNSNEDRRNFFEDISACRRRPRRPLLEQPVARVFSSLDELKHLRQRALAARIKNSMWAKGLRVADAFQLFDFDGDGVLSPSELYGGLHGLGIKLLPAEVKELIDTIDVDGDSTITLQELKDALLVAGDRAEAVEGMLEASDSMPAADAFKPIALSEADKAEIGEVEDPGGVPPPCSVPKRSIEKFRVTVPPFSMSALCFCMSERVKECGEESVGVIVCCSCAVYFV